MSGDDRLDELDYYTLLGIPDDADSSTIKQAFRRFARRYHPDRHHGASPEKLERATQIYRRGGEAMQVLIDERTRKVYDEALHAKGQMRLSPEAAERALNPRRVAAPAARPANPIRSEQARARYHDATIAAKKGDIMGAWRAIQAAITLEGPNPYLEKALAQLESRLRRGP